MKSFYGSFLVFVFSMVSSALFAYDTSGPSKEIHKGIVKEVIKSGGYTYIKVGGKSETLWAAAPEFNLEKGDYTQFSKSIPMKNFKSKTLGRTFDLVYFVSGTKYKTHKASSVKGPKERKILRYKIGRNSIKKADYTVEKLFEKRKELNGKYVSIRGKVTKITPQVMKKNWIHLQDGTGTDKFYDLVVTSKENTKVGDVIAIKGKVATNKNFGFGYFYKLIVEDVKIIK